MIFVLYYKKYSVFVVDVVGNMDFANAQDAEVKLARERTETQQRRIQTLENEAVVAGVGECFRMAGPVRIEASSACAMTQWVPLSSTSRTFL